MKSRLNVDDENNVKENVFVEYFKNKQYIIYKKL